MKKNNTPITEENDLMTVADFAKKMGVTKDSVYKRLNTIETPNGDIFPEVDENNQWRVRYSTNKDVTFKSITKRTKVAVSR